MLRFAQASLKSLETSAWRHWKRCIGWNRRRLIVLDTIVRSTQKGCYLCWRKLHDWGASRPNDKPIRWCFLIFLGHVDKGPCLQAPEDKDDTKGWDPAAKPHLGQVGPTSTGASRTIPSRFLEFLAGKFSTHQQDAHMQPFTCLRQEPTVLVQFSTGRTWQNANWRVQAMAWIEKKWLLSSICQQHIVRKAFAKLWH